MPVTVTLAQIAKFAQVQRPSVSNWRRRHADFPTAVGGSETQPLFDADTVADWLDLRPALVRSGDGAATYGDVFRAGLSRSGPADTRLDGDTFADVALSLIALRAAADRALPADPSELGRVTADVRAAHPRLAEYLSADAARQHPGQVIVDDVDRLAIVDDVDRLAIVDDVDRLAIVDDVNRLVEQLGAGGAAEQVLDTARARGWAGAVAETAPEICDLIAELATGIIGDLSGATVADLAAGPGRLLTRVCVTGTPKEIRYAEPDADRDRWLRLRLFCHGHTSISGCPDGRARSAFGGNDLVVVDPPFQSGEHEHRDEHPLTWVDAVCDSLSPDGVGFAVVPEWTLTRSATSRRLPVVGAREQLLRRGRIRAIVQLPRHLSGSRGTDIALLVLAPDTGETGRDVLVCDAAAIGAVAGDSWVPRTAAQVCGNRADRDHTVCRGIPIADLVSRRSLLPSHLLGAEKAPDDHLAATIRARESAVRTLATASDAIATVARITVAARPAATAHRSLGELIRAGQLIRLPGHRIPTTALGRSGQRVYGREELLGQVPAGERRIDPATLGQYGAASITEPGDVIVLAGETLTTLVDEAGGSVLITPVQGLRIPGYVKHSSLFRDEPQHAWIGPHALASLIGADRNASRSGPRIRAVNLHQLDIPMLADAEYDQLDRAARMVTDLAEQARAEAAALDRLRHALASGVADAALRVRLTPATTAQNN